MEPVTHILTGACMARAGLNRRAAYATLAMAAAAELPDIDSLWSLRGPVEGFAHHRGITHTLLAVPFEAAAVVGLIYGLHHLRQKRGHSATAAPIRWGVLYAFSLLALLSHLFLDYTNNYGLRPFFPFNPHWFAGSFVFIFDPLLFTLLLLPFVLPPLFGLIGSEVGARRAPFRGRGFALASFTLIAAFWLFRYTGHAHAEQLALAQSTTTPAADPEASPIVLQPQRVLANPDPLSPFRWHIVTDFGDFYQLAEVDLRTNTLTPTLTNQPKPAATAAIQAAQASALGRAYMDWSPMPWITELAPGDPQRSPAEDKATASRTLVLFRDPRFLGDVPFLRSRTSPPLTATIQLDAQNRVVAEQLDGRNER